MLRKLDEKILSDIDKQANESLENNEDFGDGERDSLINFITAYHSAHLDPSLPIIVLSSTSDDQVPRGFSKRFHEYFCSI